MLYVLNIGEEDAGELHEREAGVSQRSARRPRPHRRDRGLRQDRSRARRTAAATNSSEYLASYGLKESGLERLISATYALLGLMSFLTAGEDEVRAWTIPMNSTALKAGGAIHSDFEKKFIRAEVVNWKDLMDLGGYPGVRERDCCGSKARSTSSRTATCW